MGQIKAGTPQNSLKYATKGPSQAQRDQEIALNQVKMGQIHAESLQSSLEIGRKYSHGIYAIKQQHLGAYISN